MPAKFWAIRRALRQYQDLKLEERAGKGSHMIVRDGRGRTYVLSLHRGEHTELSDVYVRGLCRAFDLNYEEFKRKL
jgi:hypothetical protein